MRKVIPLLSAVALLLPGVAHAGWGTTFYIGPNSLSAMMLFNDISPSSAMEMYPSLDYRNQDFQFQIHVLGTVQGVLNDTIALGVNGYKVGSQKDAGQYKGVIQPGVSVDLISETDFDDMYLGAAGLLKLGVQSSSEMGGGLYVVPELGLALNSGDFELIAGGTLQYSVWIK